MWKFSLWGRRSRQGSQAEYKGTKSKGMLFNTRWWFTFPSNSFKRVGSGGAQSHCSGFLLPSWSPHCQPFERGHCVLPCLVLWQSNTCLNPKAERLNKLKTINLLSFANFILSEVNNNLTGWGKSCTWDENPFNEPNYMQSHFLLKKLLLTLYKLMILQNSHSWINILFVTTTESFTNCFFLNLVNKPWC